MGASARALFRDANNALIEAARIVSDLIGNQKLSTRLYCRQTVEVAGESPPDVTYYR